MKEIEDLLRQNGVTLFAGVQYFNKESVYQNLIVDVYKNKNVLVISDNYKNKEDFVRRLKLIEHADTEIEEVYPSLDFVLLKTKEEAWNALSSKAYDFAVIDPVNSLDGDILELIYECSEKAQNPIVVVYDCKEDYKRDDVLNSAKDKEFIPNIIYINNPNDNPFESVKNIELKVLKKNGALLSEEYVYPYAEAYNKIFERKVVKEEEEVFIGFDRIAGYEDVKKELTLVKSWWENREAIQRDGVDIPHSILLCGPTGTGKSLFAREFSHLFKDATIVKIDGNHSMTCDEITEKFEYARALNTMVIILIDEIDYVAKMSSRELLMQMDGLGGDNKNIFVIATCNEPESMNPALLRRGRLDYIIGLGNPNEKERISLLKYYFEKYSISGDFDYDYLASITKGENAVNIKGICNEVRLRFGNNPTLEQLEECIDKINKRDLNYYGDNEDRDDFMTALHEVGHAVVAYQYPELFNFYKATLESNSLAGGLCKVFPTSTNPGSVARSIADIEISLGGFLATKLLYGYMDRGAQSDLERARGQSAALVNIYGYKGFDALLATSRNARPVSPFRKYINERRSARILKSCEKTVGKLFKSCKDEMILLAKKLEENKVITKKDLDEVFKK